MKDKDDKMLKEKNFCNNKLIQTKHLVSCPCCKTKFIVNSKKVEINCECEEEICDEEIIDFPEDFVWHPSEKY